MPRQTDWRCRTCQQPLALGEEKYCYQCSSPATRKALNYYYTKRQEKDERLIKSVPLRKCKTPKCQALALKDGYCSFPAHHEAPASNPED